MTLIAKISNQSNWVRSCFGSSCGLSPPASKNIVASPYFYTDYCYWNSDHNTQPNLKTGKYYISFEDNITSSNTLIHLDIVFGNSLYYPDTVINMYTNSPQAPKGETLPYYTFDEHGIPSKINYGVHVKLSRGQAATYYLNPKWNVYHMFAERANDEKNILQLYFYTTNYPIPAS